MNWQWLERMYPVIRKHAQEIAVSGRLALVGLMVATAAIAGCDRKAGAAPASAPPEVSVITVTPEPVSISHEYPARTYARDQVDVRGRVDGYIERRAFEIGSDVKAGQVLYQLDARPYAAVTARARGALAQATADVAQAEANLLKAQQDVQRLEPLVKEEAAARQDLDNAMAAVQVGRATVESRKAAIDTARAQLRSAELDLEYATIRAPISGRIGDSLLQVGGLVSRNSPEPLTTIVPLDTIWVRFQLSEGEFLAFQRLDTKHLPIKLLLNDGRLHPATGQIENTLNGVNTRTGTLEVQARFANPGHALLPGQFARIRVGVAERQNAILVPQKAVQELQGLQTVLTIAGKDGVQAKTIVTSERIGDRWLVESGLSAGDTVIVEGLQKAQPGSKVTPMPVKKAADAAPEGGR